MVNNTIKPFIGFNLGVEILLKKRKQQKNGALKYTLYWRFKKIPYKACLLFYCFLVIKWILLINSWFHKSQRNLGNFRQAAESPKSWNSKGYFCPKNTFLQLKHIQRIYLTLLSTNCVKIYQIPYKAFETIGHFSQHNSSVFLA